MDIGALVSDSLTYSQEALVGKWTRWAIFIILALPFSLVRFVFDPKTITKGTSMNWNAIPWGQIAVLAGLGILLSFFISGYVVRIYRGTKPAPDFTGWADLFIDGIKLAIVWLLWLLPLIIVLVAGVAIALVSHLSARAAASNIALLLFLLLFLLVEFVLFVIVILFGTLGAIRFARTRSIREGIRFSHILTTIRTMGWLSYILSLIIFIVTTVIYVVITAILSFIPYIGWILVLIISPVFMIFTARYFSLIYNQGEPHEISPAPV
ncbi:MAG: DUF4013 domain-containing protein [Methanoregulaceae archaeon]|jgi:hypothetical protein